MTASDKKKAQFLVGLLVIAGLTWFFFDRTGTVAKTDTQKKTGKRKAPVIPKEAQIYLQLLEAEETGRDVGRKNIFQYRQKPLPPPVVLPPPRPIPPTASNNNTPPILPPQPPQPPPFKNFKFEGISTVGNPKTGRMMAILSEGTNTYQVKQGECLMGQYCVRQLTENLIEIEDLQLKQRKTFPRTSPQ